MKQYKCEWCGRVFTEPDCKRERDWHSEVGCYEEYDTYICPQCGSEELEEGKECQLCGNFMQNTDDVCDVCDKAMDIELSNFAWNVKNTQGKDFLHHMSEKLFEKSLEDFINN